MRIFTSLLLSLSLLIPLSAESIWTPVVQDALPAVTFIQAADAEGTIVGSCSAFPINIEQKYLLTAAHCFAPQILADGTRAFVVFRDDRKDLMVVRASGLNISYAFKLADKDPDVGDQIASIGWGFALEQPMFRVAHVSNVDLQIESLSGPFMMADNEVLGGQSGGVWVNPKGEILAVVQRGTSGLGLGVGVGVIKGRVGRYFASPKP